MRNNKDLKHLNLQQLHPSELCQHRQLLPILYLISDSRWFYEVNILDEFIFKLACINQSPVKIVVCFH
jgi:hypothetical protein